MTTHDEIQYFLDSAKDLQERVVELFEDDVELQDLFEKVVLHITDNLVKTRE